MMVLRSQRMREQEFVAREAEGESLWTTNFDARAVNRLNALWEGASEALGRRSFDRPNQLAASVATTLQAQGGWNAGNHVFAGALKSSGEQDDDLRLDLIETVVKVFADAGLDLSDYVNQVFTEHRIGYRVVEREVLDRGSDELHVSVVEPALRLLVAKTFRKAHDAYLDALKEITAGKPGDAITDAGTALQEALTALGCSGNALGPLIEDAVRKGLLAKHDKKLADWVSADRSTSGDAHYHSSATEPDAWLAVHVVGALIVRLADPDAKRGA